MSAMLRAEMDFFQWGMHVISIMWYSCSERDGAHAYIAGSDETEIVDSSYQVESAVVGKYLATLEIEVSLLGYLHWWQYMQYVHPRKW